MNLESLRNFEAVARHRSFVHAADVLHISQPALTRSIQTLEREVGGRLFDRRPHKVELTGFGSFVLERAQGLVSSKDQLYRDIEQFKGVESGKLYVGFGPLPAETHAGPCVGRFLRNHPGINLRVALLATDEMADAVASGRIDVVIGEPQERAPHSDLVRTPLRKRAGLLFCRPGHPVLKKCSFKLSDLADYPLVFGSITPPTDRLDAGGRFARRDPLTGNLVPQVECYSIAVCKQIVMASDGIGAACYSMVWKEIRDDELVPIRVRIPNLQTNYSIITLRGRTPTPAAQAFINIVREVDGTIEEPPLSRPSMKSRHIPEVWK
jgi:DNA-binding transcriptional LysR family regulator